MPQGVSISRTVVERLKRAKNDGTLLLGSESDGHIFVHDALIVSKEHSAEAIAQIQDVALSALPYGVQVVGFQDAVGGQSLAAIAQSLQQVSAAPWSSETSPLIVSTISGFSCIQFNNHLTGKIIHFNMITPDETLEYFAITRCSTQLQLPVYLPAAGSRQDALEQAVENASQQLDPDSMVYIVSSSSSGTPSLLTSTTEGTVAALSLQLFPEGPEEEDDAGRRGRQWHEIVISLSPMTRDVAPEGTPSGPQYVYQPAPGGTTSCEVIQVSLEVLCYIPGDLPLAELGSEAIIPAFKRQLTAAAAALAGRSTWSKLHIQALQFLPPGRSHHVCMLYTHDSKDEDAVNLKHQPQRLKLHQLLGLPQDRQMLRIANALDFSGEGEGKQGREGRLRNVHATLKAPVHGAEECLVSGTYLYYHYMQDKINDNGWGCAYRSLQTLCSWFLMQKYTKRAVPSHRQIQEILVKLGDKERSFIGSSQWIGAIELGYVLDEYLGVTSKIITVNRGEDIPSYARQLAQHFATQGTPVMIGGGVLAYTLLGVQFNENTGECAFLILDPHYTGGEDLKKIHSGTWVAWKKLGDNAAAGGPLFVKDAFYNFLCPQLPNVI